MKPPDYLYKLHLRMTPRDWWKHFREVGFHVGMEVMHARITRGMTQEELAVAVGTKQPSIARLENGSSLPSTRLLRKVARATGNVLEVRFVPFHDAIQREMWPFRRLVNGTIVDFSSHDTTTVEATFAV